MDDDEERLSAKEKIRRARAEARYTDHHDNINLLNSKGQGGFTNAGTATNHEKMNEYANQKLVGDDIELAKKRLRFYNMVGGALAGSKFKRVAADSTRKRQREERKKQNRQKAIDSVRQEYVESGVLSQEEADLMVREKEASGFQGKVQKFGEKMKDFDGQQKRFGKEFQRQQKKAIGKFGPTSQEERREQKLRQDAQTERERRQAALFKQRTDEYNERQRLKKQKGQPSQKPTDSDEDESSATTGSRSLMEGGDESDDGDAPETLHDFVDELRSEYARYLRLNCGANREAFEAGVEALARACSFLSSIPSFEALGEMSWEPLSTLPIGLRNYLQELLVNYLCEVAE
mmetsp:Transcript_43793/g.110413  ORF Transcript_43793/g.110413 Transcript_43793/m.110413 type:complete len:347 (+) Transcript_43793:143-1183(+)